MQSRSRSAIVLASLLAAMVGPGAVAAATPIPGHAAGRTAPNPAAARSQPAPVPESVSRSHRVQIRWTTAAAPSTEVGKARTQALGRAIGRSVKAVRESGSHAVIYDVGRALGGDAAAQLAAIAQVPGVVDARADLWMTATDVPNDPLAGQLWGLLGNGDGSPYGIDVQAAWATTTGAGVVVAVIDTGLAAHPDLAGQTVAGYDMVTDPTVANDGGGRDADPSDPGDWCNGVKSSWHGTHVAGTIAALAGNNTGVFGGAPGVKIEPVRVLGTCGGYESDIADGIRWAAGGTVSGVPANANPARVLNLSLGGLWPSCPVDYLDAIADARSRGAIVVVAAGNSNADSADFTPANCSEAVTVAAVDSDGKRASFSNFGSVVDLAGPGVGIWSTLNSGTTVPVAPAYAAYNGTSMAAPHVALSAALLAAAYPDLSPDGIELLLEDSARAFAPDTSGSGCPDLACGRGAVTAAGAMARIASGVPVVGDLATSSRFPAPGGSVTVTARAVDSDGIASAQRQVDGGAWVGMTAGDGTFDDVDEALTATLVAPSAEGDHVICVRATDAGSSITDGTACTTITVDAGPPSVTAPVATLVAGSAIGATTAPLRVGWSGSDSGAGVAHYELSLSTNGGPYAVVGTTTSVSTTRSLGLSTTTTYRFRLRAFDKASHASGYAYGPTFHLKLVQQSSGSVHYGGAWSTVTSGSASGGSYRQASIAGRSASLTFTGRTIAVVAHKGTALGSFKVYIDGTYRGTASEHATTAEWQRVIVASSLSPGTHTIKIVCSGTAGHPKIALDAFVVLG